MCLCSITYRLNTAHSWSIKKSNILELEKSGIRIVFCALHCSLCSDASIFTTFVVLCFQRTWPNSSQEQSLHHLTSWLNWYGTHNSTQCTELEITCPVVFSNIICRCIQMYCFTWWTIWSGSLFGAEWFWFQDLRNLFIVCDNKLVHIH